MQFPGFNATSDREEIKRTIDLLAMGNVVELRALKAEKGNTVSGYFDKNHRREMIETAEFWSGKAVGVYILLNPVPPDLMGRANNRAKPYAHETTKDGEIVSRVWLPIDFDPTRPSGVSSTDEEHELALSQALKVREFLRFQGWPEPILADSGNGFHLIYRIELPNDNDSLNLVTQCLELIASKFSTEHVKTDTVNANAARIWRLYGTLNAKGDSIPNRPHRLSRIIETPDRPEVVSIAQLRALVSMPDHAGLPAPESRTSSPEMTDFHRLDNKSFDVKGWLASHNIPIVEEKDWEKGARLFRLNPCPFNPAHDNNAALVGQFKNGGIFFKCFHNGCKGKKWHDLRDLVEPGWREKNNSFSIRESIDDPHRLSRIYLAEECLHFDGWTLRYFAGNWYRWDGVTYRETPHDELEASLYRVIKAEFDRHSLQSRKAEDDKDSVSRKVTGSVVNNVMKALRSEVIVPGSKGIPCWIDGEEIWAAEEVLPATNGLFHIPSLADGNSTPMASTPRFFSEFALDYEINPQAERPLHWLNFLHQLWSNDPESISTLQEWMGYILTPDTRQQKILMIIGPPRSGKSTIGRIMTAMIGKSNVAGPQLSSFRGDFGLQPLLGKSLAIISDARLRGPADIVTERLLSISGEDTMTVNRKGIVSVHVKLMVRIVLISNELPRFDDSSGALVHRMILLCLRINFKGREDTNLADRLLTERPGILKWAIEGWRRLRDRGHFIQPSSSDELIEELNDLSSPVGAFVKECCNVGGSSLRVPRRELYQSYLRWCEETGCHFPDKENTFGRNLRSVVPSLGTSQPRIDSEKVRFYTGISLRK